MSTGLDWDRGGRPGMEGLRRFAEESGVEGSQEPPRRAGILALPCTGRVALGR